MKAMLLSYLTAQGTL